MTNQSRQMSNEFGQFETKHIPGEGVRNFYRRQGAAAEREKIIKLLKELQTYPAVRVVDQSNPIESIIQMIKGAQ
jgi:hypothetical protein